MSSKYETILIEKDAGAHRAMTEAQFAEQVARHVGASAVRVWPSAEQLERDFRHPLVRLRPLQLQQRPFRPGDPC